MLGMDTSNYKAFVPRILDLVDLCMEVGISIFYTEAVREPSGIGLLTTVHMILPRIQRRRGHQRFQSACVEHGMHNDR